jgi:hypothetical protein
MNLASGAREERDVPPTIHVVNEDRVPRHATRDDMEEIADQFGPRDSWHHPY